MIRYKGISRLILALLITSFSHSHCTQKQDKLDCKRLKNAKLKYTVADDATAYIVISGNRHMEYYNNNQDSIVSKLEWLNDCEYNAIFLESSFADLPFKAGEKLNVKFEKIEDSIVYCNTKMGNRIVEQKLKLLSYKD